MTAPSHPVLPDPIGVAARPDVSVRLWQVADAAALTELVTASIEHLRPFMPWISQEPLSAADRAEMIAGHLAEHAAGGDAFYAICRNGDPVGAIGAHHRIGPAGLELGYWISPQAEGQGIVTAAVRALTEAVLALPGITRVEIRMDVANERSAAVPRRCGYRLVGRDQRPIEAPAETGWGYTWRIGADPDASAATV